MINKGVTLKFVKTVTIREDNNKEIRKKQIKGAITVD